MDQLRIPVFIVGFDQSREVEQIYDEAGEQIIALRPVPGSERAYLQIDVGGLLVRAKVTLSDLNNVISHLEVQRDLVGGDPSYEAEIQRLDALAAKLIGMRTDASIRPINEKMDAAIDRARELIGHRLDLIDSEVPPPATLPSGDKGS